MSYHKKISERLRMQRARMQLSQQQVAKHVLGSQNAIGLYERGKTIPDAHRLALLADLYGVTADYLCGKTDYPELLPPGMFVVSDDGPGMWQIPTHPRIVSYEEAMRRRGTT